MNISHIEKSVQQMVPDAKDCRTRDTGGRVHAFICELHGRTKSVQFDGTGLYPPDPTRMWVDWPKSDLYIAAEIAKELNR